MVINSQKLRNTYETNNYKLRYNKIRFSTNCNNDICNSNVNMKRIKFEKILLISIKKNICQSLFIVGTKLQ